MNETQVKLDNDTASQTSERPARRLDYMFAEPKMLSLPAVTDSELDQL